jgi:hypothetical protein
MVIGCVFFKEKEWEGMLTSLHFFLLCWPSLPRQGYCVQIHYRLYSSLRDFGL